MTVAVDGQQNSTAKTLTTAINGREQRRVTGIIAATVALTIRDTAVPDGVHHVHEVLDPEPILDVLREQGYRLTNSEQVRETASRYTLLP